jgi:hypothetical protein
MERGNIQKVERGCKVYKLCREFEEMWIRSLRLEVSVEGTQKDPRGWEELSAYCKGLYRAYYAD